MVRLPKLTLSGGPGLPGLLVRKEVLTLLIPGQTTIAMRCPQCGKLDMHPITVFQFSGGRNIRVLCSCGSLKVVVGYKRPQTVWLQIPCFLCEGMHFLYYTNREFWAPDVKAIICPDTDLQLGAFGAEDQVQRPNALMGDKLGLLDDAAMGDFFDNSEVMYQVLSRVNDMAETGNLHCACGNRRIEVDIYSDRLELVCPECQRSRTVVAVTEEDLVALKGLPRVDLDEPASGRGGARP